MHRHRRVILHRKVNDMEASFAENEVIYLWTELMTDAQKELTLLLDPSLLELIKTAPTAEEVIRNNTLEFCKSIVVWLKEYGLIPYNERDIDHRDRWPMPPGSLEDFKIPDTFQYLAAELCNHSE